MDATEIALRCIGAFYVFAGYVATRAALTSHVLDKAIAGIGGKGLSRIEIAITAWHLVASSLVMASGLAALLLLDFSRWLFLASALGQAAYIYVVAPIWFDAEDPPDLKGRRQTTNAFVIYSAATAFVFWAGYQDRLLDWGEIDLHWMLIAGAALVANGAYALWVIFMPSPQPLFDSDGSGSQLPTMDMADFAARITRVKVHAARECHPLWALDDDLYGDFPPSMIGLSEELSRDLAAWGDDFAAMIDDAQDHDREPAESDLAAHQARGRHLAARVAAERSDLLVFFEVPGEGETLVSAAP